MYDDIDLLTLRGVARRLHLPADWLRAEVDAGRLPAVRAHTELLFHYPTVVRLLGKRAAAGSPQAVPHGEEATRG